MQFLFKYIIIITFVAMSPNNNPEFVFWSRNAEKWRKLKIWGNFNIRTEYCQKWSEDHKTRTGSDTDMNLWSTLELEASREVNETRKVKSNLKQKMKRFLPSYAAKISQYSRNTMFLTIPSTSHKCLFSSRIDSFLLRGTFGMIRYKSTCNDQTTRIIPH